MGHPIDSAILQVWKYKSVEKPSIIKTFLLLQHMKANAYESHKCTPLLTPDEEIVRTMIWCFVIYVGVL